MLKLSGSETEDATGRSTGSGHEREVQGRLRHNPEIGFTRETAGRIRFRDVTRSSPIGVIERHGGGWRILYLGPGTDSAGAERELEIDPANRNGASELEAAVDTLEETYRGNVAQAERLERELDEWIARQDVTEKPAG